MDFVGVDKQKKAYENFIYEVKNAQDYFYNRILKSLSLK